jgi:GTP cyclohydrolase I
MIDQAFEKNTTFKSPLVADIFNCEKKDDTGLNDFQKLPTNELIAIQKVGINNFRIPLNIKSKFGEIRSHDAKAAMYVDLNAKKNGVSMSRFINILQSASENYLLDGNFIKNVIARYRDELRDETDVDLIGSAFLKVKFNYAIKQKSLKSENWGWQYYPVTMEGKYSLEKGLEYFLTMEYEYSSTCPCSLSMAKQYEREFKEGLVTEGSGIGVPHSQRSKLFCKVKIDVNKTFFIEDLLMLIKTAIPTETQSFVKRVDEQAFAILNGSHPMFVEHASKRMYRVLNAKEEILDWICSFEHYESLHSHNAAAVIYKGVAGGLKEDPIF